MAYCQALVVSSIGEAARMSLVVPDKGINQWVRTWDAITLVIQEVSLWSFNLYVVLEGVGSGVTSVIPSAGFEQTGFVPSCWEFCSFTWLHVAFKDKTSCSSSFELNLNSYIWEFFAVLMCLDKFQYGNLLFLVGQCEWAWQIRCTGGKDWMKELLHFCPYPVPSISYHWLILLSLGTTHSSDLFSGCKFKVLLEKQKNPKTQNKPQPNTSPPKAPESFCLIPWRKWTFGTENDLSVSFDPNFVLHEQSSGL